MEKTVYISASWNKYSKELEFMVTAYRPSSGVVIMEERTIQFETPADKELKVRIAEVLRADLQTLRGEHYVEEKEKEEEIQELLALEDKSQEVPLEVAPVNTEAEDDIPF